MAKCEKCGKERVIFQYWNKDLHDAFRRSFYGRALSILCCSDCIKLIRKENPQNLYKLYISSNQFCSEVIHYDCDIDCGECSAYESGESPDCSRCAKPIEYYKLEE